MVRQCVGRFPAAGFSLLELLVTLFVIVLVTSMVSLTVSTGGQDIQLESQVRSLANVAGYAMDEAQMGGVDYGLVLFESQDDRGEPVYGYEWVERQAGGWRAPQRDSEVFEPQEFPPGLELFLQLEDSPVEELGFAEAEAEGESEASPQVILYASGETTPGSLELRQESDGAVLWRVEWDLLGRFSLLRRGIPDDEDEQESF